MATGAEATEATGHTLRHIIKSCVPEGARRWLRKLQGVEGIPATGRVHFGSLRRVLPISRTYGFDRGQPIDRYYIERFLARHADDIRGRVLEIADDAYTRRFGGRRVTTSDVLHVVEGNPHATIVADLTNAGHLPSEQYDCVILTQVLSVIYDVRAALRTVYRLLKPGGTLLATTPGVAHHL
ncbi:MAG TPA: methyltransferase domain-containing protein, partial [Nitrospiraceae bacterium]|nr:methyltransferase domain-containing protein [Nitrospiraceae bacterium]